MQIKVDENSFGITQRSLKILRDELAHRIEHKVEVYEIPTSELCCGFLIVDFIVNEAVWTGDGFRTDRKGEGGAGYKTAEALFMIYGIETIPVGEEEVEGIRNAVYGEEVKGILEKFLSNECKLLEITVQYEEHTASISPLIERPPFYVR